MSTTTCTQCRARKIRCDTRLPECQSCTAKGLECTFFDVSTAKEIPRRELDGLMRRATELEAELSRRLKSPLMQHQAINSEMAYPTQTISTGFLVRSTVSSELIAFMRQLSTHWPNVSFRPPRFVAKEGLMKTTSLYEMDYSRNRLSYTKASTIRDEGKPAILRQLVKHWVEVVQPEFPLLTSQQIIRLEESDIQSLSPTEAIVAAGLYSVSAALFARDCSPEFSRLEAFYCQQMEEHIRNQGPVEDPQLQRQEITLYLFKVLHHLVKPNQKNINLHAFISLISQRYKQYFGSKIAPSNFQKDVDQVATCLYILESTVCLQLGLPSALVSSLHDLDAAWAPEVFLQKQIHEIEFGTAVLTDHDMHALITDPDIFTEGIRNAAIRKSLALYRLALSEALAVLDSGNYVPTSYLVFSLLIPAARDYIEEISERNRRCTLFSIQLTTERILQAGAIMAAYLVILSMAPYDAGLALPDLERPAAILCLMEISALLASFRHRWPPCSTYMRLWDALTELILHNATK